LTSSFGIVAPVKVVFGVEAAEATVFITGGSPGAGPNGNDKTLWVGSGEIEGQV
jgi:hypothetical protein